LRFVTFDEKKHKKHSIMLYSVFSIKVEKTYQEAAKAYAILVAAFGKGASSLQAIKEFIDNQVNMQKALGNHFIYDEDDEQEYKSDFKNGELVPNFVYRVVSEDRAKHDAVACMNSLHSIIHDAFPKVIRIDNEVELVNMETEEFLQFADLEDSLYIVARDGIFESKAPVEEPVEIPLDEVHEDVKGVEELPKDELQEAMENDEIIVPTETPAEEPKEEVKPKATKKKPAAKKKTTKKK